MRFLFFILFLTSFTASANPDSSQFAAMAQELDYILTQIEEREQMGVEETTYVHMRPLYNTKLASLAKNKTPISQQAIEEANAYLYKLDSMKRKTIMFYTFMFFSEKDNNKFDYKTTIEKTFDELFARRDRTGKINVLINVMIYNQKLTDRADQYSFNIYQDKMRQSYELEDGLEKAVHAELSKEIKNKTANTMSKNCNKALVFRAKLLLEKVKVWKKETRLVNVGILRNIFPNTSETRLKEVSLAINKYQNQFEINTKQRMANFLAQIGTETGGLVKLSEGNNYSPKRVVEVFGMTKYSVLFQGYTSDGTCEGVTIENDGLTNGEGNPGNVTPNFPYDSRAEIRTAYADPTTPIWDSEDKIITNVAQNYNLGELKVKTIYYGQNAKLFNVTYSCRLGNRGVNSGDGAKFKGAGFIHLTGRYNYREISKAWNADPSNAGAKKYFHLASSEGGHLEELINNVDVAIKASMYYWKKFNLNNLAGLPISRSNIQKISGVINVGRKDAEISEINGFEDRVKNTEKALNVLSND